MTSARMPNETHAKTMPTPETLWTAPDGVTHLVKAVSRTWVESNRLGKKVKTHIDDWTGQMVPFEI